MLVFLALLSLASAASIHDSRVQILPSSIHSGYQTPISLVQLLRGPVQTVLSPRDRVQYFGQTGHGLESDGRQYSIVSVEPNTQNQYTIESGQPLGQQYTIGSGQPLDQQVTIISVQPQTEQLSLGAVQQIGLEKRIILQPQIGQEKQVITLVQPDVYKGQIDNLRISTQVQPLQYSNVAQSVYQRSSGSDQTYSRPSVSVQEQRDSNRGVQQYSYFLRGSDLENQQVQPQVSVVRQQLEPPQYSSVSVLEPRISAVVVQPSKQINVQGVAQPHQQQVGVVGYSNVYTGPRIVSHSIQDSSN